MRTKESVRKDIIGSVKFAICHFAVAIPCFAFGSMERDRFLLYVLGGYATALGLQYARMAVESWREGPGPDPWDNAEEHPQLPGKAMVQALGHTPTYEEFLNYVRNHLWWRPPYCKHPEISHCVHCPLHLKETSIFHGERIDFGVCRDCRNRDTITKPRFPLCYSCHHCKLHTKDEFFDCGCADVRHRMEEQGFTKFGQNLCEPMFYPRKTDCPYYEYENSDRAEARKKMVLDWLDASTDILLHVVSGKKKGKRIKCLTETQIML